MLKSTKTKLELAQLQLTLNDYIWGDILPSINVSNSTTDEIFSKIKPILRKNTDPLYITFTVNNLNSDRALKDKVKNFIDTIIDFSSTGIYSVAPIIEYALIRDSEDASKMISSPEDYFRTAVVKSGGGLEFTYRDTVVMELKNIVTDSYTPDFWVPGNADVNSDVLRNSLVLVQLLYDDILELFKDISSGSTIPGAQYDVQVYMSRLNILVATVEEFMQAVYTFWNVFNLYAEEYGPTKDYKINQILNLIQNSGISDNTTTGLTYQLNTLRYRLSDTAYTTPTISNVKRMKDDFIADAGDIISELVDTCKNNYDELMDDTRDDSRSDSLTAAAKADPFKFRSATFFIRLYPRSAQVAYPNVNITTGSVSDNRLMSVINGSNNLECVLSGNLALNTLDAQWLDLYANIFDFMTTLNLRSGFNLKFGSMTLRNCYFKVSPRLINTGDQVSLFDLNLISTVRSLSDIQTTTYGDNNV